MPTHKKSIALSERAKKVTPGGVQSSLRYFEPYPLFLKYARGSKFVDVDGNEYIDYLMAYGPPILGHSPKVVLDRVREQLDYGIIWTGNCPLEVEVAEILNKHIPSAEMVRFANTGTEATYQAIRTARAVTGREKILKFEGNYHGWHDYAMISYLPPKEQAGPEDNPRPIPDSGGTLGDAARNTLVLPYNRPDVLEKTMKSAGDKIAAVIVEPIMHNVGCIMPTREFLRALRELTEENGAILIFDEVITGIRHDLGGVQRIFGVTPDLTTLSKALANGFPISALCGKEEFMKCHKPIGDVFTSGTYNANPVSLAASVATLSQLESGETHKYLFSEGDRIRKALSEIVEDLAVRAQVAGFGSIFWIYFTEPSREIRSYRDLLDIDTDMFFKYQRGLLERGIFICPNPFKRCMLSAAHSREDNDYFLESSKEALQATGKLS